VAEVRIAENRVAENRVASSPISSPTAGLEWGTIIGKYIKICRDSTGEKSREPLFSDPVFSYPLHQPSAS
jgi:hypothetical protein